MFVEKVLWYIGHDKEGFVSSLIVYQEVLDLQPHSYGIGSVATSPAYRNKVYGSQLVKEITEMLFKEGEGAVVFLHSNIDFSFYEKYRLYQSFKQMLYG
ncbi:GNAT family N-acetyltransferase [Spirochaeta cellobiosiphila]|uniref:GNAT family N-acetyltransferase n=1 Tax=Spirochaeta cellobiosiphila TaxID=504483 RepID=UPI0003FAF96D|nr:GNAT family N-acetyltransferase [Spirochaeta cellobiosiphila]